MTLPLREKVARVCAVSDCDNVHVARGFCSKHYQAWRLTGYPVPENTSKRVTSYELLQKLVAKKTDDCINWPRSLHFGYGKLWLNGRSVRAARLALILSGQSPPSDRHFACHAPVICHNRACVNPRHLRWALPKENTADKYTDGTMPLGEAHSQAKITRKVARSVFVAKGTYLDIAIAHGLSKGMVGAIKRREAWRAETAGLIKEEKKMKLS